MISELLIFIDVQVVFQNFKLAVMAKVQGIFFLIVGDCDKHMHHVDLSDKNYLSDFFKFFDKISIRLIRFSLPPFSLLIEAWNRWIIHVWIFLLWVL